MNISKFCQGWDRKPGGVKTAEKIYTKVFN